MPLDLLKSQDELHTISVHHKLDGRCSIYSLGGRVDVAILVLGWKRHGVVSCMCQLARQDVQSEWSRPHAG